MERDAIEAGAALADCRRDFGQRLAARREKIEMTGFWYKMIVRRLGERRPDDIGIPFIRRDIVVLGAPKLDWLGHRGEPVFRKAVAERRRGDRRRPDPRVVMPFQRRFKAMERLVAMFTTAPEYP